MKELEIRVIGSSPFFARFMCNSLQKGEFKLTNVSHGFVNFTFCGSAETLETLMDIQKECPLDNSIKDCNQEKLNRFIEKASSNLEKMMAAVAEKPNKQYYPVNIR